MNRKTGEVNPNLIYSDEDDLMDCGQCWDCSANPDCPAKKSKVCDKCPQLRIMMLKFYSLFR